MAGTRCLRHAEVLGRRLGSFAARPGSLLPACAARRTALRIMPVSSISNAGGGKMPSVSERVRVTDSPVIVKTKQLMAGKQGVMSLAQGVVHWSPPKEALLDAAQHASDAAVHGYGPCEGLEDLRAELRDKLREENGLTGVDVMVTMGANQAFVNVLLALADATDRVVLFKPYYFNHLMAIQMTGGGDNVVLGECDPGTWHPDLDWLERELTGPHPPKIVVIINPNNPTGVLMSREELERASSMCAAAGCWLVLDNTYEHFTYDGRRHHCLGAPHIVNLFSFSKAYGMMGWRVGYIAYPLVPSEGNPDPLGSQLIKVQDTIPICPTQLSQRVALWAVRAGRPWVAQHVQELEGNRQAVLDALSPLGTMGEGVAGGEGAIYFWARLPQACRDDQAVVEWLVNEHGVCVIPGSSCGCPGYIRAAYANLTPDKCAEAATRLKAGLEQLVRQGGLPSGRASDTASAAAAAAK